MSFWWDDWMNFVAMAMCITMIISSFEGCKWTYLYLIFAVGFVGLAITIFDTVKHGYGKDIWTVQAEDITECLKIYYVATGMYVGARTCTRISILSFYLRIFPGKEARRKIIYTLIAEIALSIASIFVMMFQCTPVSYYWTQWDLQHPGQCIDTYIFKLVCWSILIAADFWVLWLPLPMVAGLQLSMRRRLLVSVMFAIGIAVTAVGIAKLFVAHAATHTTNPTFDLVEQAKFCLIEVELGVICSCMPSLPVLFRPLVHRLTGKHKGSRPKGTGTGYIAASLRGAGICDNKPSVTASAGSYPATEQIQAVTTLNQTYWRHGSDGLPLHGADIELGSVNHGYAGSRAWAAGPGDGS